MLKRNYERASMKKKYWVLKTKEPDPNWGWLRKYLFYPEAYWEEVEE